MTPLCRICEKRHWTYEPHKLEKEIPSALRNLPVLDPAINKEERLTDAINVDEELPAPRPTILAEAKDRNSHNGLAQGRGVVQTDRTPNRRNRQDYNVYMKEYMRKRRSRA